MVPQEFQEMRGNSALPVQSERNLSGPIRLPRFMRTYTVPQGPQGVPARARIGAWDG